MHYNDFSFLIASWVVVISTGTVEVNQALGLRSPVLLDEGFTVGSQFGAHGTPMAVLALEGQLQNQATQV